MSNRTQHQVAEILRALRERRDVHRTYLMHVAGLWDDAEGQREFTRLMAKSKDEGLALGLRIVPVVERIGWWTAYPTDDVVVMAETARAGAHHTEWDRFTKIAKGLTTSSAIAISARNQIQAIVQTVTELRPQPDRRDDCLQRIDAKIAAGHRN